MSFLWTDRSSNWVRDTNHIFDPTHGMARGAGLIDIKMGEERATDGTTRCVADGEAFLRALEKIYEMRDSW